MAGSTQCVGCCAERSGSAPWLHPVCEAGEDISEPLAACAAVENQQRSRALNSLGFQVDLGSL